MNRKNLGVCIRPDTEFDNKGAYSGSALPTESSVRLCCTGNHLPTEGEGSFLAKGDASLRVWELKRTVEEGSII